MFIPMKSLLFGKRSWEEAAYLLSGVPLGIFWFTAIVTVWTVFLSVAVTPFVILMALAMPPLIRAGAAAEAALVRRLLHVNVYPPHAPIVQQSFWRRAFGWLADPAMWRAQVYLGFRAVFGFGVGILVGVAFGLALGGLTAPFWYWPLHGGIDLNVYRADTLPKALLLVPAGAVAFVISMLLTRLFSSINGRTAQALLEHSPDPLHRRPRPDAEEKRRILSLRAASFGLVTLVLIIIWALTGANYFWPIWPMLAFALVLGAQGWRLFVEENQDVFMRPGMSPKLAQQGGVTFVVFLFLVGIWAASGGGNFWPVWPLLAFGIAFASRAVAVYFSPPDQKELTQRIETLTTTRAGAVDQQEAELRRIERDLHDGAQARLVALGMSIGMAEQKMKDDPEGARELLEEARAGAGQALKELRDLARGIHPPVLADRGLEAAVTALADASPLRVTVQAEIPARPAAPVESAAYFVVAEALANATKHSEAKRVDIRMRREGDMLTIEVADDGVGGADPHGSGLSGLRRRIEALDGTLRVASPAGGPTLIRADMPCGS
jgi:signal transduction histidine kinase